MSAGDIAGGAGYIVGIGAIIVFVYLFFENIIKNRKKK